MSIRVRYLVGHVEHRQAAEYALRSILEMVIDPGCLEPAGSLGDAEADDVVVVYGIGTHVSGSGVCIVASGFFGAEYCTAASMPRQPVVRIEGTPALYGDDALVCGRFYTESRDTQGTWINCHVDMVAGAFFMLSRCEETVSLERDRFGRFPVEASISFQEGFLQEPVVNAYAGKLMEMLRAAGFVGERRKWWGNAAWAVALTHDVDQMHRFPRGRPPALAVARSLMGKAHEGSPSLLSLLVDYARTIAGRKADEYDCLEEMAAWEVSIGARASYYLLCDNHGRRGADYSLSSPETRGVVRRVSGMGHEVGFHAGMHAFEDATLFHSELQRLLPVGVPVHGGRQHYLRWSTPATWRLWEAEGLAYDTTLGYSKVAGFRCGTCLPFHPYDIESDRQMSILEWPLMFMDSTYESSWSEGVAMLERLSCECRRYGGVLVLLWHNRNWSQRYAPAVREHFQTFLEECTAQGVAVNSVNGLQTLSRAPSVGCDTAQVVMVDAPSTAGPPSDVQRRECP